MDTNAKNNIQKMIEKESLKEAFLEEYMRNELMILAGNIQYNIRHKNLNRPKQTLAPYWNVSINQFHAPYEVLDFIKRKATKPENTWLKIITPPLQETLAEKLLRFLDGEIEVFLQKYFPTREKESLFKERLFLRTLTLKTIIDLALFTQDLIWDSRFA